MGQIKNIKLHIVTDIKSKKRIRRTSNGSYSSTIAIFKTYQRTSRMVCIQSWVSADGFETRRPFHARKSEDMDEAFNRLPEEEANLRIFRIKRAADLSLKHAILPKEQWTKPEEDVIYLSDVVKQVKKEREERERYDQL